MDIQTFYPVFENGQVLTSEHLNDIVDYLEPQDRLTRSRLIGIGVVCGFRPAWRASAQTLTLSHGAAVTSEGYLIAEDEVVLDRVRPYSVPVPAAPDATSEEKARAWYNDPDYQALSEHRRAATKLNFLTLVHGLSPRG